MSNPNFSNRRQTHFTLWNEIEYDESSKYYK